MKILHDLAQLRSQRRPLVLAAGFFDGVHRGHQKVIQTAIRKARALNGKAWVMTFSTHPMKVLRPEFAPLLLTSPRHRAHLLQAQGLDGCLMIPFNREFAALEPDRFVEYLHASAPTLKEILIGPNWRFGHQGRGTPTLLRQLAAQYDIRVTVVPPARWQGEFISSTRIREAIGRADLRAAATMLGRPFSILGTVVHGRGIGHHVGYPTANLDAHNEVMPSYGIYVVHAQLGRRHLDGVLSYGIRPTFPDPNPQPAIELYLLAFHQDIYGQDVEVHFLERLRDEQTFPSVDALRLQIQRDVRAARRILDRFHRREKTKAQNPVARPSPPLYSPAGIRKEEK